jgi:hypothetical protein
MNLHLISFFISHEEGLSIVEKYDKWSLYPMFLKLYHYSHPMSKFEVGCAYQIANANYNVNIF